MIDTKRKHMRNARNVRNEPYAFVAYDWPPRGRTCVINVMSPTPLKPMIDTKRTHMRNVCNELYTFVPIIDTKRTHMRNVCNEIYAFVAYDWHQEDAYA